MFELKGKYGTAKVFSDNCMEGAVGQIIELLNQPMAKDAHIRIMPDYHAGAGCVIGYTAYATDKIVPNLIGVDIGCGVLGVNIGKQDNINFQELDDFIRANIPLGMNVRNKKIQNTYLRTSDAVKFWEEVKDVHNKIGKDSNRAELSMGSLGGGNHFIELGKDSYEDVWLFIHTGSRNFGKLVAEYYQEKAIESCCKQPREQAKKEIIEGLKKSGKTYLIQEKIRELNEAYTTRVPTYLAYLKGDLREEYLKAMKVAQVYAQNNRWAIASAIAEDYFDIKLTNNFIESVHNYIEYCDDNKYIIRKGAIKMNEDKYSLIALNMKDGVIICKAKKNNEEWNFSAPHGAGRLYSRSKAKKEIPIELFKEEMKDIWSSSVNESTLDEAPMAYKDAKEILNNIAPMAEIKTVVKPIYNLKA